MSSETVRVGDRAAPSGLHYGWIILGVATLTVMGSLGFGRFGYTMILPPMQSALGLTNTQTGNLATGNFFGYLTLALLGGLLASRFGPRRVIAVSMLLTGATMALTGVASGFGGALAGRTLTGLGSGGSNVPVMSLVPAWFGRRRRGLATGIATSGNSLALVIVGPLVPAIVGRYGPDGWRVSWFVLGGAVALLGLLGWVLLRDRPGDMGLQPIGAEEGAAAMAPGPARTAALAWGSIYRSGRLWHLALVYAAFGIAYVIYATFFARYLQTEGGYSKEAAGGLWATVGWIGIFCGPIWGAVSDRIGRGRGLALVFLVHAFAYATFSLWRAPAGFTLSAVAFGLTAWSVPSIVAAACGDYVEPRLVPAALGFVTLFFGLGQAAGPSLAGMLADATGSFGLAFLLASGVAVVGSIGSVLLRPAA